MTCLESRRPWNVFALVSFCLFLLMETVVYNVTLHFNHLCFPLQVPEAENIIVSTGYKINLYHYLTKLVFCKDVLTAAIKETVSRGTLKQSFYLVVTY